MAMHANRENSAAFWFSLNGAEGLGIIGPEVA